MKELCKDIVFKMHSAMAIPYKVLQSGKQDVKDDDDGGMFLFICHAELK